MAPRLPLEGVRVVDISVIWAGPYGAWMLAQLGAEVIHIDNPFHQPDRGRFALWTPVGSVFNTPGVVSTRPPYVPGDRPWNQQAGYNRWYWNRKAVSINLRDPEGVEVARRLIDNADVYLENNSAHAMESLGMDYKTLLERNPKLICINAPAWGRSGPYKDYVGWGALHEAVIGHTWLWGYPDEEHPMHNNLRFHMDDCGGNSLVMAVAMGLIHRRKSGKGMWVDMAQIQAVPQTLGEIYLDAAWNKRDHRTMGNRHPTSLQGCYLCRGPEPTYETGMLGGERWVNITIQNDAEWQGFLEVLGNPDWAKDAKFATHESRYANHDLLDRHISAWTRYHDNFEVFQLLQAKGIAAGPVNDWRESFADPQLNARGYFQNIYQEDSGSNRYHGAPWKFSKTPAQYKSPPMTMGEHTEYVCKEVIGMSEEEYNDLREREVIGRDTYPWLGKRPDYEGAAKQRGIKVTKVPAKGELED